MLTNFFSLNSLPIYGSVVWKHFMQFDKTFSDVNVGELKFYQETWMRKSPTITRIGRSSWGRWITESEKWTRMKNKLLIFYEPDLIICEKLLFCTWEIEEEPISSSEKFAPSWQLEHEEKSWLRGGLGIRLQK